MKLLKLTVTVVLVIAAMSIAGPAFGQGRGNGKGGGNGGGPGEETTPNSLSVPAIFVADPVPLSLPVGLLVYPESDPLPPLGGFSVDNEEGLYFVQGIHRWQADNFVGVPGEPVYAAWGDNLKGDARLKVGSPIRVEVGLYALYPPDGEDAMTGWNVIKLEPQELDRLAPYGTVALVDPVNGYVSEDQTPYIPAENPIALRYPEVRVYDSDATWTITGPEGYLLQIPARAEINSTGRIVYGHNLRVGDPGTYTIQFYAPNVDIQGTDDGDGAVLIDGNTVALDIEVQTGGGKGGGRPDGPPDRH